MRTWECVQFFPDVPSKRTTSEYDLDALVENARSASNAFPRVGGVPTYWGRMFICKKLSSLLSTQNGMSSSVISPEAMGSAS